MVVAVEEIIGQAMREAASIKLWRGVLPAASNRSAYSATTIAPSTSMPATRIRLNSTTMLSVKTDTVQYQRPLRKAPGMVRPTSSDGRGPSAPTMMIMTRIIANMTLLKQVAQHVAHLDRPIVDVADLEFHQTNVAAIPTTALTVSMVSIILAPARLTLPIPPQAYRPPAPCWWHP